MLDRTHTTGFGLVDRTSSEAGTRTEESVCRNISARVFPIFLTFQVPFSRIRLKSHGRDPANTEIVLPPELQQHTMQGGRTGTDESAAQAAEDAGISPPPKSGFPPTMVLLGATVAVATQVFLWAHVFVNYFKVPSREPIDTVVGLRRDNRVESWKCWEHSHVWRPFGTISSSTRRAAPHIF